MILGRRLLRKSSLRHLEIELLACSPQVIDSIIVHSVALGHLNVALEWKRHIVFGGRANVEGMDGGCFSGLNAVTNATIGIGRDKVIEQRECCLVAVLFMHHHAPADDVPNDVSKEQRKRSLGKQKDGS